MRVISFAGLREKGIPYSPVWIRKLVADGRFPKPIPLGANRVAFVESEVDQWLKDRCAERDAQSASI